MTERVPAKYLVDTRQWRDKAACRGSGIEFFIDPVAPGYKEIAMEALSLCVDCPVRLECIIDCAQTADSWSSPGIWGGTTNAGRRHRLRRARVKEGNVSLEELPLPPYARVLVA